MFGHDRHYLDNFNFASPARLGGMALECLLTLLRKMLISFKVTTLFTLDVAIVMESIATDELLTQLYHRIGQL